jgi:hypothetical protein
MLFCFTFGGVVVEVVVVEVDEDVEKLVEAEARLLGEVSSDAISAKVVSGRSVVESGSDSDGCVISRVKVSVMESPHVFPSKLPKLFLIWW